MKDQRKMDKTNIEELRKKDVEQYLKDWDRVKSPYIKGDIEMDWFDYACGGLVFHSKSRNNYECMDILEECYKSSKQYELKFLFDALETILDEASLHLGKDVFWIHEGFHKALKSKIDKANERFKIGFFIQKLVEHGAPKKPAFEMYALWQGIAETTCRSAFHELQRSNHQYNKLHFWQSAMQKIIQNSDKPFPDDNSKVFLAYKALQEGLNRDVNQIEEALERAHKTLYKALTKRNSV